MLRLVDNTTGYAGLSVIVAISMIAGPITIIAAPNSIAVIVVSVSFGLLASHLVLPATFVAVAIIVAIIVEEYLGLP
jgi:hypothetical protein